MGLNRKTPRSLGVLGVAFVSLVSGCLQTAPAPVQPAPAVSPVEAAPLRAGLVFEVDPLHGAAFEQPGDAQPLPVVVEVPDVTHDLATGRTTVRMQVSNAGEALARLDGTVSAGRPLVSGAIAATDLPAGANRSFELVFDNPSGDRFAFDLAMVGKPGVTTEVRPLAIVSGVTASASSTYGTLYPARVVDNNLSTQWANNGYREAEAWLTLDTGAIRALTALKVKMRPQSGGAYYRLEVSSDNRSFQPVTGNLKSATWNLETKALPAGTQGRYLRIHFFNDPASPEARFGVYEAQVDGGTTTGSSPSPTPTPTATPTPTPSSTVTPPPSTTGKLSNTFEQYNLGVDPSEFIDPINEGYSYSWMPRVPWKVTSYGGSKQYLHDGLSNQANLSFRRYRGTAFAADGALPNRYFAAVDVTPIKSYTYAPTGDQGTQFYYLTPTRYLELLIKPDVFEVWAANDAQPFTSRGWQRLYYTSVKSTAGQKRNLAAEVDAVNHTMKVYLDGQLKTTVSHSMLSTQTHFFALRGTGNQVVHDNLRIEPR